MADATPTAHESDAIQQNMERITADRIHRTTTDVVIRNGSTGTKSFASCNKPLEREK